MLRRTLVPASFALACSSALAQSVDALAPSVDALARGFVRGPSAVSASAPGSVPPITLPGPLPPNPFPTPPLVGGSDNCSTADVIAGTGSFAFDFTSATTGSEGQISFLGGDCNAGCAEYGNAQVAIPRDVWFTWTAPTSGRIDISTCGQITDTKLAVYDGTSGCPTGAVCMGCNDDWHYAYGFQYDSRVVVNVSAGQNIKIQIGSSSYGTFGTTGTISIGYLAYSDIKDDGTTENAYAADTSGTSGQAMFALSAFGEPTTTTTITGIQVAWGSLQYGGATNGTPARVAIWKDPTNDADPIDAILLQTQPTTVQLANSDTLVSVDLIPPVTLTGIYFVGVVENRITAQDFPFAYDGNGCLSQPNTTWLGQNPSGTADLVNLGNNPPFAFTALCQSPTAYNGEFHGSWLLRPVVQIGPIPLGTTFCSGDGVAPHSACPCNNDSGTIDAVGCLSSLGIGGKLRASGVASLAADTALLQGTQMPSSTCLYFQGTTQTNGGNGFTFGDGLRCAGGTIIRLGATTNVAGSSSYPFGAAQPIHIRGAITVPGVRTYQGWYRNAASFCTPFTFNLTNGLEISWAP